MGTKQNPKKKRKKDGYKLDKPLTKMMKKRKKKKKKERKEKKKEEGEEEWVKNDDEYLVC